ncbi:hypothetical protein SAMN03080602_02509 [Arenibacter troitsensis]|uniref:Uncharacterized protein n=1 Tax=Arenibacter troitsensis TaxID=188872 RepID=A0A1X7K730_9FLAO|nr:hypothetical protein SAMN03080602_02509 [Arenibacter troitsensis]
MALIIMRENYTVTTEMANSKNKISPSTLPKSQFAVEYLFR